jgi:hypothetical protein
MIAALALATPATAQRFNEGLYWLQVRLIELGFDLGEPDGISGPRTRAGLAAYSTRHIVPAEIGAVMDDILRRSRAARRDPTLTPDQIVTLRAAVTEDFFDPDSARFGAELWELPDGGSISRVCGTVNARNRFGAYVGARHFYVMRYRSWGTAPDVFTAGHYDNADGIGAAAFRCLMTGFEEPR